MRIISSPEALNSLEDQALIDFIKDSSPWLTEAWNPKTMGYAFILYDEDSCHTKICCTPHIPLENEDYRKTMTIDLTTFEDWEYATYDKKSQFYQVLALFGSEYGADIFMSKSFVDAIPKLKQILDDSIKQERSNEE